MLPLSELDGKGYTVSCRHAGVARLRFRLVAHIDPVIFVENVFPEDNHLPAAASIIPRAQVHQAVRVRLVGMGTRSEEHTSEIKSLMRNTYAVFCLKQKKIHRIQCKNNTQ